MSQVSFLLSYIAKNSTLKTTIRHASWSNGTIIIIHTISYSTFRRDFQICHFCFLSLFCFEMWIFYYVRITYELMIYTLKGKLCTAFFLKVPKAWHEPPSMSLKKYPLSKIWFSPLDLCTYAFPLFFFFSWPKMSLMVEWSKSSGSMDIY